MLVSDTGLLVLSPARVEPRDFVVCPALAFDYVTAHVLYGWTSCFRNAVYVFIHNMATIYLP